LLQLIQIYDVCVCCTSGAVGYFVHARTQDREAKLKERTVRVGKTTRAVVHGLDPGTRYTFQMRSIGSQEQLSYGTKPITDQTRECLKCTAKLMLKDKNLDLLQIYRVQDNF